MSDENRVNQSQRQKTKTSFQIYGVEHFLFENVHTFWTYERLTTLFERCDLLIQQLDHLDHAIYVLLTGSIAHGLEWDLIDADAFVDIRDLSRNYDFNKEGRYAFLMFSTFRWDQHSQEGKRLSGFNLVAEMRSRNETSILKLNTRVLASLLAIHDPSALASSIINKQYLPYTHHAPSDADVKAVNLPKDTPMVMVDLSAALFSSLSSRG